MEKVERNKETGLYGVKDTKIGSFVVGGGGIGAGQFGFSNSRLAEQCVADRAERERTLTDGYAAAKKASEQRARDAAGDRSYPNGRRAFGGFRLPRSMCGPA